MNEQQTSPFAAPWPAGVIARYATVGGATVDLTRLDTVTRAKCLGCGQHEDHKTRDYYYSQVGREPVYFENRDKADKGARDWAQDHAATCRAMPRPEATR